VFGMLSFSVADVADESWLVTEIKFFFFLSVGHYLSDQA
jgi:hypothetical protein